MSLPQLHTQYLVHLYLSTISCIYSLFYSTISCVLPRPLTPQPFILCILRYIDTISCGPETIWVYFVCYGITQHYILCRPNILWSVLNLYYILDSYWSCADCYISPLHPSAYNAAYSAHNPCRRREARYLAFQGLPVKSHRPKPSRAISSVFQYIVLYTIHQPQYLVVSNGAMNMCILHKISQVQYLVVDYAQLHNISPCYEKREICCLSCAVHLPV